MKATLSLLLRYLLPVFVILGAGPIARELLEAVAGRNTQVAESLCRVEDEQLPLRRALHVRVELATTLSLKDKPCAPIREASNHPLDHLVMIT